MDPIRRSTPPATANGRAWQIELSGTPTNEWLGFFKAAGRTVGVASPQMVVFDRASATFQSGEGNVEHWIGSIDGWIAAANERYVRSLDEADRERSTRLEAEARERDRILELNERFKNL
ncbi:MAG TPA: hypothetical protein VEA38_22605 [Terriglobales bacterium]|nr:hypothetical protein [Terriglobales bacterium]